MPVEPTPPPPIDTIATDLDLFAPLTLDELYGYADTQLAGNQQQVRRGLAAAILFCQTYTRRSFVPEGDDTSVTKPAVGQIASTTLRVPDVRAITSLEVDGEEVDPATCVLLPDRAGRPAPRLRLSAPGSVIAITGTFGFLDVPADIRDAIYTDAIRRSKDKDAGYADRVDLGDGTILSYFRTMPARVQATYNSLRIATDFIGAG